MLVIATAVIFTAYEIQRPFYFMSSNTIFVMAIILSYSDSAPLSSVMKPELTDLVLIGCASSDGGAGLCN
jgi:hypothetical protein